MTNDETKQRNRRNKAIAGGVVAFIVVIYLVTFLRLSGSVTQNGITEQSNLGHQPHQVALNDGN
ncbi:MAG: hypothetical protein AAF720_00050 [Pseudomonadota bacterium]